MAQAKVVKSRRGNDLAVLTMGPKEVAKVLAVLEAWGEDTIIGGVEDALTSTQANMRKQYEAEVKTEIVLS
jgi:hypothetical protein